MDYKREIDLRLAVSEAPPLSGPVHVRCIYHNSDNAPSLAVFADGVHCYACGANHGPLRFLADYLKIPFDAVPLAAEHYKLRPFVAVKASGNSPDLTDLAARYHAALGEMEAYFIGRCLLPETISAAKLGYTGRAYSLPMFDRFGRIVGLKYRRDDETDHTSPKYWNQRGTSQQLYYPPCLDWQNWTMPLVVVEGELDALVAAQWHVPAITSNSGVQSTVKTAAEIVANFGGAVLAFDIDGPGAAGLEECRAELLRIGGRVEAYTWPAEWGKDVTDVVRNGHKNAWLDGLRSVYRRIRKG